jgi:DNA-binding SARP family transcriptional activator
MEFAVLGPLEAHDGARRVPLGGPRQRVVLARLLVDAGRVVPTDRLVEDVWDGRPPTAARKTLQKYVHWLRQALAAPVLQTAGSGYAIDLDGDGDGDAHGIDAHCFERLMAAGESAAALELWRGQPYADLPAVSFVETERTRLTELRLAALEDRLQGDLAAGRHATAVAELGELVEAHPLRERLVGLRVLALYRSGRQVEALRQFERHRSRLAEEVGVRPVAELCDLEAAILRHDPALDLPRSVAATGGRRTTDENHRRWQSHQV